MPITFENIIHDRVLTGLEGLIVNEFNIPVYLDEHRGNQSFLLTPSADNLLDYGQNFQSRDYAIEIEYRFIIGGKFTKNNFKQVSNIAERLKTLIKNNSAYSDNGDYKWQDGRAESIEYAQDEEDESVYSVIVVFNCTSMEVS